MNVEHIGKLSKQHVGWLPGGKMRCGFPSNTVFVCLVLGLLIITAGCLPHQETQRQTMSGTDMAEANQIYESGAYDEAVQRYQAIVDAGVADGAVYYNIGNAYFKLGDLGRAILNYRRAQRLLPRDEDIRSNLQLARAQTRDRLEREGNGLVNYVAYILIGWSTTDEVAIIALAFWVLLCGFAVVGMRWHRQRHHLGWVMVILSMGLVLGVLSLGIRFVDAQRPQAVIVASSVDVRSGPGVDYLVEFSLHTGAEVRVLERRSAWARITLPGNLQGWVPDEVVEDIE